jgi:hypothetical protein
MKKSDVKIGNQYKAKVTNKVVTVQILSENPHGGWDAKNLETGKKVRIKSAQRLRRPAGKPDAPKAPTSAPGAKSAAKSSKPASQAKSANTPNLVQNTLRQKKASALDSAVRVLSEAKEPQTCKQMIETMAAMDYWKPSHGGKTPANTLYAAILKEISTKGKESRFQFEGKME